MKKYLFSLLTGAVAFISCAENQKDKEPAEARLNFKPLASPVDSLGRYPHLMADEDSGRLWMSWTVQHNQDSASLWASALDAESEEWEKPVLMSAGSDLMVNWADYPHLLQNGGAHGILYLKVADPTEPYAYHVMWKDQNKAPQRLHTDSSATEHGFVSTAKLPNGQQGVIWLDGNKYAGAASSHDSHGHGGEMSLRFRTIAADGSLMPEQELDGRTCDCCNTAMVAIPKGALAFYRNRTEGEVRDIYYMRYQDDSWSQPKPLHQDNWEIAGCPVNGPAADASGEQVAVAWFTGAGGQQRVNVRFSPDAGESWGKVITADSLKPMGRVDIQLLENGSALVSWLDDKGQLLIRQVDPQGKQGAVQVLADSLSSRKSGFPQLVRLKDKVYLAWTKPTPSMQLQLLEGSFTEE